MTGMHTIECAYCNTCSIVGDIEIVGASDNLHIKTGELQKYKQFPIVVFAYSQHLLHDLRCFSALLLENSIHCKVENVRIL